MQPCPYLCPSTTIRISYRMQPCPYLYPSITTVCIRISYRKTQCPYLYPSTTSVSGSPTGGSHVRGSGRLDLLNAAEALLLQDFVKVRNDLIEEAEALHPLVVGLQLHVELGEVRDGGEDDATTVTLLVVQLLNTISFCYAMIEKIKL